VRGLCHAKAGQTTAKNVLISQDHSAPPPGPRRRIDACQTKNLVVYSCRLSSLPVAPPTPPASTRQLQERKESAAALPSIRELLHSKHRTYALHEKQETEEESEEEVEGLLHSPCTSSHTTRLASSNSASIKPPRPACSVLEQLVQACMTSESRNFQCTAATLSARSPALCLPQSKP